MQLDKIVSLVFTIVPVGIAIMSSYLPANYNKELIIGITLGVVLVGYALYNFLKNKQLKKSISNLGMAHKASKTTKKLVRISRLAAEKKDKKTLDLVLDCVKKSDRILMYLGMYRERIEIGQNLVKALMNKDDFKYKVSFVTAKIDYIGWTYVLTGQQLLARIAIEEGRRFADDVLARLKTELNLPDKKDQYAQMLLLRVRAMRHLCSMPESKKYCEDFESLGAAEKFLTDNISELEHWDKNLVKYNTMMCGIYYGMALCNTEKMNDPKILEQVDNLDIAKISFSYLDKCEEFIKKLDEAEPGKNLESHRRVKIKLLRDKILAKLKGKDLKEAKDFFDGSEHLPDKIKESLKKDDLFSVIDDIVDDNLEECMKYFNNNIFVDESMINYLDQRVQRLASALK